MELKVLGSVSPYSSLDKNGPGFFISDGNNKVLLDCGDGVTSLMNMETDLDNLTVIISHLHKDHYSGLFSLGYASYVNHNLGFLDKKIDVYIPSGDIIKIKEFYTGSDGWGASRTVEKPILDYQLLHDENFQHYFNIIDYNAGKNLKIGNMKVSFKMTKHPLNTYAVKMENDNYKLCYSADTGYCEYLCDFFKDADLLICESTFLKGQTRTSNEHLYAYEAGRLAKKSNVKELMLTHFWPEIDKENYLKEANKEFANVSVAIEGRQLVLK